MQGSWTLRAARVDVLDPGKRLSLAALPDANLLIACSRPTRAGAAGNLRVFAGAAALCLLLGPFSAAHAAQAHVGAPQSDAHPDQRAGYLGVSLLDLDQDTASRLHLKDTHGALIVTIDRDAPAASAGLRARDVVVEASGQRIENVEALRRRLRETSAGSTMTLRISRDGAEQLITVQLGDQAEIAKAAWLKHFSADGVSAQPADASASSAPEASFVPPRGSGRGASFLGHFTFSSSYTGAEIDPLSTQLADFFGVHDGAGLLVRTVNTNSPASLAGLRAGDVILRVNNQSVVSREDWTKQLHANRGKAVQLSVMRNRREQTMTMTAGNGKKG